MEKLKYITDPFLMSLPVYNKEKFNKDSVQRKEEGTKISIASSCQVTKGGGRKEGRDTKEEDGEAI